MEAAWDEAKNNANQKKHGISFEEAGVLFTSGVDYLEIFDEFHSHMEDRFLAIGPYTEVFEDAVRIISARPATSRERSMYQGHLKEHQR